MHTLVLFQVIPLAALGLYFLFLIYYHVLPMCRFKLMLYRAIRRNVCLGIQSGNGKITVRYLRDGRERRYTKTIDDDVPDRFVALTACRLLKSILSDIENGVV
ncbi:MAG: hypothetical protein J5927_03835 [Oscillospiraceae bacterium]|nr:hypothetical protein [Oscillospiraceae bacterium]